MGSAYKGPFVVFIMALLGFFMALIEQMAYDSGYMLDQFISSASMLQGFQILTIVVAMLLGCIIAAATQ
jgi:hypothetical protein